MKIVRTIHSVLLVVPKKKSTIYRVGTNQIQSDVKRFMEKRTNSWGYLEILSAFYDDSTGLMDKASAS